ncbi:MAG: ABC transporter permease [Actinobacteria bacterium]|nr:ABC transporter permease [Actinomycetota bacterium]
MSAVYAKRPPLGWTVHDSIIITRATILASFRIPEALFFQLIQPVIFVILFAYVFGAAIPIPGADPTSAPDASLYRQYLMPGIFGQTVAFAAAASTVGLAEAMQRGIIDRYRALPMSQPAALIGNTIANALRQILALTVLSITGLIVGWRINDGIWNAILAYLLLLLFAYTVTWVGAFVGLSVRNSETASTAGLIWIFPLTFLSNAFVPITALPTWLQYFAAYNPISSLVLACRELFGNPIGTQPDFWPLQNPVEYTIISCAVVIAIFAPLAVRKFRTAASR